MRKRGPCYQCPDRYWHCTDTCEKHHEYFSKQREINEKRRNEKIVDGVMVEGSARMRRVKRKER